MREEISGGLPFQRRTPLKIAAAVARIEEGRSSFPVVAKEATAISRRKKTAKRKNRSAGGAGPAGMVEEGSMANEYRSIGALHAADSSSRAQRKRNDFAKIAALGDTSVLLRSVLRLGKIASGSSNLAGQAGNGKRSQVFNGHSSRP